MKKRDFKKLMLLGISAGALLASQAGAEQNNSNNGTLLAGGCGGRQGCKGYTPYPPANGCASTPNYNNGGNGNSGNSGNSTGKNNGGYTAYQPTHGCGAHQPYYNTTPSYPPQQGCASYQPAQPSHQCASSHGCGGAQPNNSGATPAQPQNQTTYNQWSNSTGGFTAEATKPAAPAAHATAPLTESDLLSPKSPLNEQSKMLYRGLDQEGKTLALKLINQSCKGQNECKGLNSCKTKDHSCAGRGSCAGTSAGPFQDKNQAVKIAAMRMAEKRAGAIPGAAPSAAPSAAPAK